MILGHCRLFGQRRCVGGGQDSGAEGSEQD